MDCNSKLFLEFSLLKEIMLKEKQTLKFRLARMINIESFKENLEPHLKIG